MPSSARHARIVASGWIRPSASQFLCMNSFLRGMRRREYRRNVAERRTILKARPFGSAPMRTNVPTRWEWPRGCPARIHWHTQLQGGCRKSGRLGRLEYRPQGRPCTRRNPLTRSVAQLGTEGSRRPHPLTGGPGNPKASEHGLSGLKSERRGG